MNEKIFCILSWRLPVITYERKPIIGFAIMFKSAFYLTNIFQVQSRKELTGYIFSGLRCLKHWNSDWQHVGESANLFIINSERKLLWDLKQKNELVRFWKFKMTEYSGEASNTVKYAKNGCISVAHANWVKNRISWN